MKMVMCLMRGWLLGIFLLQPPFLFGQSKSDCLACHADTLLAKDDGGRHVSLFVDEKVLSASPHAKLVCVGCHTGFKPDDVPHKATITPVNCLTCHNDVAVRHTFHPQLARAILNHEEPDVSCKDCHGTHNVVSPKVPGSKFNGPNLVDGCGECHGDVKEHFAGSSHGKALAAGVAGAPDCLTCHRNPVAGDDVLRDTLALKLAQEKLCLSCHLDNPGVRSRTAPTAGFIASYENSVHGSELLKGNASAANCVDCHGAHEMNKGREPSSLVNRENIPNTCGKCHAGIAGEYRQSVHGTAMARGVTDAPACTNCHGEHTIYRHDDPRSPVAAKNVSAQVCSPCHTSVALASKYGLAADRFRTFSDSYHGLAIRGGSVEVANCASCHGSHSIKPSSDSTSSINKGNLAATCGKCHPGANQRFAVGSVHVLIAADNEPTLYWVTTAYIVLIVITIGGMLFHNVLDFRRKAKRKLLARRGLIASHAGGHTLYLRMTRNERVQHLCLLIGFTVLVITGFMLRFPESWWVEGIRAMSSRIFAWRSLLHRAAGVLMVGASLYHIGYVAFTRRGRELLGDLLPKLQDLRDAAASVNYLVGLSQRRPLFGRFSYIEKSEYWALVWGTLVMAVTGMVMWFDNTFIGLLTKMGYDIARTIHYYEAWLATLAIIVWHLYFVVFNPDVYPLNLAFWKGTLSEEEMEDEHPLELEDIRRREQEVKNRVEE
jgi:cytochrome b subunit of formate dehydrogenase